MNTHGWKWLGAGIILLTGLASAMAQAGDELDRRYTDSLNGFSIRPPAGAIRSREFSTSRLVAWQQRDANTNAIAWTFSVLRATPSEEQPNLQAYAHGLEARLQKNDNFKIESTDFASVGGKEAVQFRGLTGGTIQMWQRQTWVLTEKGKFLVFVMAGPVDSKDALNTLAQKALDTVQFIDPRASRIQREKNLTSGYKLTSSLTRQKIADAVIAEPQWFLMRLKGQDVGFMAQTEAMTSRQSNDGFEVKTWVMLQLPKDEPRLMKRVMFATPDGSIEFWNEQLQVGSDARAQTVAEEGTRENRLIVSGIQPQGGKVETRKKAIPKIPLGPDQKEEEIYLPRATGFLLGRLVDRQTSGSYAFAVYTSAANDFDMRTFTIFGPETITLDGKKVSAIRGSDQVAADEEPATIWLDSKGRLLRMASPEGLVMESVSQETVFKAFPSAEGIIRAMDKWAR